MASRKRIAVTLPEATFNVEDTIARVRWAESRGFDDAWFADFGPPDALTTAGILSGHVTRLRIGVAVTPVYTRTPAVLASTAYALAQAMPGRFAMGLGSSSHAMIEGWHGVPLEKPLTRVRETALMVRSMLAGEKSAFDLDTLRSHGYRQPPLENPPPIVVAGLRENMIEMAAEVGDGVAFNLWPRGALGKMMAHVDIGAARGGKTRDDLEIVNRHQVCVTDDPEPVRQEFRARFAPYYATPVYNRFLSWAGYEDVAATIREGWAERDRNKTTGALDEALVDEIAIIGSRAYCQDRVREAAAGGVDTHIIACASADPARTQATFEAFASDAFSF